MQFYKKYMQWPGKYLFCHNKFWHFVCNLYWSYYITCELTKLVILWTMLGCEQNYSLLLPKMFVLFVFGLNRLAFLPFIASISIFASSFVLLEKNTHQILHNNYLLILDKHLILMSIHCFWFMMFSDSFLQLWRLVSEVISCN